MPTENRPVNNERGTSATQYSAPATSDLEQTTDSATDKVSAKAAVVADKASDIAEQAKQAAFSQLAGPKGKAAESLGGMAESLRQATRAMEQGTAVPGVQYVHKAADQLEALSRRLNEGEVEELLGDVEQFARRQPALFLGLALAGGLALARFLKSSGNGRPITDRLTETYRAATSQAGTDTQQEGRVSVPVTEQSTGAW